MQTAKLIGGAGTGKTTELLRIMEQLVERLGDPHQIGFVSFTRAARREAAERTADRFGLSPADLEQHGWFRTLHSVCYKVLGISCGELLADTKDDEAWLADALGTEVHADGSRTDFSELAASNASDADRALALWSVARNRLEPFEGVYRAVAATDDGLPNLTACQAIIEQYEQAKRLDGRSDYTDLLTRFAGYHCHPRYGVERRTPQGDVPALPAWFFDEQQDTSALLDGVCKRLVSTPACRWCYLVGDPFQSIYGWAGADPSHFMAWKADKQRVMPRSYRCPPPILELGERILRQCSDYWDRGILPADRDGAVEAAALADALYDEITPESGSWLLIARTNFLAARLTRQLESRSLPWMPTRGRGGLNAPTRNNAINALYSLETGAPIDGGQWQDALKHLPSTVDGARLLEQGTKKRFKDYGTNAQEYLPWVQLHDLADLGGTENLRAAISTGLWRDWIKHSNTVIQAMLQWGPDALNEPPIRVGTIHSVKGAEADNVVVLDSMTEKTGAAVKYGTRAQSDEEQRVWYVAATRARKRLIIAQDVVGRPRYTKSLPI